MLPNRVPLAAGLLIGTHLILACQLAAQATIDLGTTGQASQFRVTGAGASAAVPYAINDPQSRTTIRGISLTSTADSTGTFVSGGSLASFDGFWYADETFFLPVDATNVTLNYTLFADDRVVIQLNGATIGNFGLGPTVPFSGTGLMRLSSGGTDAPFPFSGTATGSITSGFQLGTTNTIRLIVNNTNAGSTGATQGFQGAGDYSFVALVATVSYGAPPLEPNDVVGVGVNVTATHRGVVEAKPPGMGVSLLSDSNNPLQGPTISPDGLFFRATAVNQSQKIFMASAFPHPGVYTLDGNGIRTPVVLFNSSDPALAGYDSSGIALEPAGTLLVIDRGNTPYVSPKLYRVTPGGSYGVVSDFSVSLQGPVGVQPYGVAVLPNGQILVADALAGTPCHAVAPTDGCGALFQIDPVTGRRSMIIDFGDGKGPFGWNPANVAVIDINTAVVTDAFAGCAGSGGCGAVFKIDLTNDTRTFVSDFGRTDQGPGGLRGYALAFHPLYGVLTTCVGPGDRIDICTVDMNTGQRAILYDFTGTVGIDTGISVVPHPPTGTFLAMGPSPVGAGTVYPGSGYYFQPGTIQLWAVPNPGYAFTGFSGGAAGTTNPRTYSITGPANIVANFAPAAPALTASISARADGPSPGTRNVTISLSNSGVSTAANATITSITGVSVVTGSGTASVASALPVDLGPIVVGGSASTSVLFNWPATATRVRFTVNFTAAGGYSGSTVITSFR